MKMTEKALTALKTSIAHWEKNVAAALPSEASDRASDCALCDLYNNDDGEDYCIGCPVRVVTGKAHCRDTPYRAAFMALGKWEHTGDDIERDAWRKAAQAEVDFLRSLLPKGAK